MQYDLEEEECNAHEAISAKILHLQSENIAEVAKGRF